MSAASGQRRIKAKIKPPRKHGPDFSIDDTWGQLSKNIREIQNDNASNLSFEENYRLAYNMVLYKHGDMLYKGVNQLVTENIQLLAKQKVVPLFPAGVNNDPIQRSQEGEMLLKAFRNIWDEHTRHMSKLRDILKYMDRVYSNGAEVPEIYDSGINLFHEHIIRSPIKEHLYSTVLNQVHIERDGYVISPSAVKGCVDVLLQLKGNKGDPSVYKRDLEPAFLKESEEFYKAEGINLLETCDAPEYLRRVDTRFRSEESRTHHYLYSHTAAPLLEILENNLITPHLTTVVSMPNSGLDAMIDLDKIDDMARMYRLFIKVPTGLPCLRKSLKDSIIRRGREINQANVEEGIAADESGGEKEDAKGKGNGKARAPNAVSQMLSLALKWVQDVLDMKDKFDQVWKRAFQSDREIESGFTEAFETFINANVKAPEFISLFIDENLKKGLKGKTDNEVDIVLDKTITVFRYLSEKDVFERYYKKHLARRLLLGRSVSDDAERGMLAKLKVECGYQFTQKLEGMFHDMKISSETMQAYRQHLANITAPEVSISVTVMTSTFWPTTYSGPSCTLPEQLVKSCKSFEQFYYSRHSGRVLTWQPSQGNADVKVTFKARKHDLNVSTFALIILLLFEDLAEGEFLTYEEIKVATSMADIELQRQLQSLACAKFKILKKHPPGRDVNSDDSFSFNHDFTAPLQKIKISTIASKVETGEETKETRERVDEERRHQTEACIVRIMKDRKHMTHNDLINEVTRQLISRFQPNPLDIKKRIEGLIEREYLERCEDRKSYNYLA